MGCIMNGVIVKPNCLIDHVKHVQMYRVQSVCVTVNELIINKLIY